MTTFTTGFSMLSYLAVVSTLVGLRTSSLKDVRPFVYHVAAAKMFTQRLSVLSLPFSAKLNRVGLGLWYVISFERCVVVEREVCWM